MRPWNIALVSAFAALAAAAAWQWPALSAATASGSAAEWLASAPLLALTVFAAYAGLVLLLTTVWLVIDIGRIRFRIAEFGRPGRAAWSSVFADTGLADLAPRLLDLVPAGFPGAESGLILQSRFDAARAQRETISLYNDWLTRAQAPTALVLLLAAAIISLQPPIPHLAIPSAPMLLAVLLLLALAGIGRFIVGAAAERLSATIEALPLERLELRLLRALTASIGSTDSAARASSSKDLSLTIPNELAQIAAALERDRGLLLQTASRLSASAESFAAAARETAERQAGDSQGGIDPGAVAQLQSAILDLAARIDRLSPAGRQTVTLEPERPLPGSNLRRLSATETDLSDALRRLIAELE